MLNFCFAATYLKHLNLNEDVSVKILFYMTNTSNDTRYKVYIIMHGQTRSHNVMYK